MNVRSLMLVLVALSFSACDKSASIRYVGGQTMGTSWSVKVAAVDHGMSTDALTEAVQNTLDDIEAKMSNWRDDSDVSRFNAMPEGCMAVSADTINVVQAAQEIAVQSHGAFDISLGPLIELWGFGKRIGSDNVPVQAEIDAVLSGIGYQGLRIEGDSLCKARSALSINVSAIAKGYAVDQVAAAVERLGYQQYLVEVGGELFAKGEKEPNTPWRVGVEKPDVNNRQIMQSLVIPLNAQGLATSGDYRNFFVVDGRRYSHLLDPTTGLPVQHQVASVSVLAESSMRADGWATAILVLGAERGLVIANQLGLAVLILEHGEEGALLEHTSEAWPFLE